MAAKTGTIWVVAEAIVCSAIIIGGLILAGASHAQSVCGERSRMVEYIFNEYQEEPTSLGITSSGNVVELFTSSEGSWTILVTYPDGRTCLVGSGESWEKSPVRKSGVVS